MDIQVIIYVAIGFGVTIFVLFLFMMDNAIESLGNWAFTRLGWISGHGPLLIQVETNGNELTLILQNHGQTKMKLAAVEARDCNSQRHFPKPQIAGDDREAFPTEEQALRRFSKIVLNPQSSLTVNLNMTGLLAVGCSSLVIIDSNGKSWPVQAFDANLLIRER